MFIGFQIPMEPRGQARPRAGRRGKFIQVYKDSEQRKNEDKILTCSLLYRPEQPICGELTLTVKAFFPIPKSKPKKFRAAAQAGEIRPSKKPDLSNIIKHIEDSLNGVFWVDDAQIVAYGAGTGKYYAEIPHYEIEILSN